MWALCSRRRNPASTWVGSAAPRESQSTRPRRDSSIRNRSQFGRIVGGMRSTTPPPSWFATAVDFHRLSPRPPKQAGHRRPRASRTRFCTRLLMIGPGNDAIAELKSHSDRPAEPPWPSSRNLGDSQTPQRYPICCSQSSPARCASNTLLDNGIGPRGWRRHCSALPTASRTPVDSRLHAVTDEDSKAPVFRFR